MSITLSSPSVAQWAKSVIKQDEIDRYLDDGRDFIDDEAIEGIRLLTMTEGILPALESAHAIAALGAWVAGTTALPALKDDAIVLLGLSGRGDKDLAAIADRLAATVEETR